MVVGNEGYRQRDWADVLGERIGSSSFATPAAPK